MRAALFDMDRTLVRRETASLYVRYQREIGEATRKDLLQVLWWVAQYTAGVVDVEVVAGKVLATLEGLPEVAMASRCDDWFRRYVEEHVCDAGRRAVERHREAGDLVAIVSGGSPYAAIPLARRLGIEHIVTSELEVDDRGLFTGKYKPPLAIGQGKVERARRLADELGFRLEDAVFYTDSHTDLPLLELVAEPVIVNPDLRLRRTAKKRGWRIETW